MKQFTKESLAEIKKLVESYGFSFYGDNLRYTDVIICKKGIIEVRKDINNFRDGYVEESRISWSSIGSVNVEKAQEVSNDLQGAIGVAKLLKDLKTEELVFEEVKEK